MVSENQQGNSTALPTEERKILLWPDEKLMSIEPMTQEGSLTWFNAAHRQDASKEVKQHFKQRLQSFR